MIPSSIDQLGPPPAVGFALLSVPKGAAPNRRCNGCCHWALPLIFTASTTVFGVSVAMEYEAWILWHAHVLLHQRDELRS